MTMPRLGPPPSGDQYLAQVAAIVNAELDRLEPQIIGWYHDGTNLHMRFRAALATPWVQVQVQSTAAGGGGTAYTGSAGTCVSRTLVDCRANRIQDVTVADLPYGRYVVWLVPVQQDGAGLSILFDGQSGRPDNLAFIDIGV